MTGRTIRSVEEGGRRVLPPARRPEPRFVAGQRDDGVFAVVDGPDGLLLAYATPRVAHTLAAVLNALATVAGLPTGQQVAGLLGDGSRGRRLLRTIVLRSPAPCRRCGRTIHAGTPARWNHASRLVQHLRRCPAVPAAERRIA